MHVSKRSAGIFAALTLITGVLALVGATPARAAASYHCQHRVQDGVWSWTFNRDSYTTGLAPTRHPVKPETLYVTAEICNNRTAADRLRITSTTACLTDPTHSSAHTGATFNPFFHTQETATKVNPPAYKVVEDGSPEHRCARRSVARSIRKWVSFAWRPVVSVVSTQNVRFPYPDPVTDWRTSSGSRDRRMYESDFDLIGVKYWPGY